MKISIELAIKAASEVGIDKAKIQAMLERINDEAATETEEKPPRVKKQFVVLVSDPQGFLKGHDFAGWVLQIPEEASPVSICERIHESAYAFNATKKGRLLPVQTIGEAVENVPSHHFKERDVWVKTKTPVLVVTTNNEIPRVDKLASGAEEEA